MIHMYKMNGFNIVMDINSGAIHLLDDTSYELLEKFSDGLPEKLPADFDEKYTQAFEELTELKEEGLLFSEDFILENLSEYTENAPIKALCLHVAHDCNLRCDYCFAAKGDFKTGRCLMDFETGKKAIDFVIEHSGTRKNIEVDFFGGEPLMNFDVVKQIVDYTRGIEKQHNKNFRFTITTNGVLLSDDKIEYINKEMSNVVLSLDGRKSVNDRIRKRVDGSGSYDTIVPKYKKLVATRGDKDYYVRGTFTSYNLDFTEDIRAFLDEGFTQLSIEPAVTPESEPYALKKEHIPAICEEYERLAKFIVEEKKKGNSFNFFHFMIDLKGGPCIIKRLKGCGCGNEYIAVTPEGDIYPCHQFVGGDFKMGNVHTNELDLSIKNKFANESIYKKEDCKTCFAKYYCSGGCNANNHIYNGDILKPLEFSCELERKRVECAIMIQAAVMSE
ncbi:MAG: thioether cross-link-forming SCIFF peptide maturase [Ruminococcaceae bacterium]|nr:thioether cross-link-forming SCIFF peptide maturase [Oscillospiraceae bacterium]